MYISSRAALVRNLAVAFLNGGITLIILLIAPLGIVAVIVNTILVTVFSFVNATAGDAVVNFFTTIPNQNVASWNSDLLEGYGQRVQYSVFECLLEQNKYNELKKSLINE